MALGEKTGEDHGTTTAVTIKSTGPEGVTIEVNYTGEVKGSGRYPDGTYVGTANVVQGPSGINRFTNQALFTTKDGETVVYRSYGTGKSGGIRTKSVELATFTTAAQKYAWMNDLIFVREGDSSPDFKEFKGTTHEWK